MTSPSKTGILTARVPVEILDWVDADLASRGKTNRSAWVNDLLVAVKEGRLKQAPVRAAAKPRTVKPYPKPGAKAPK